MPLWRDRRPLKRWRYVGVYGERFMLCAGVVHVAGVPQSFWAVWDRGQKALRERTIIGRTRPVRVAADQVVVRDRGVEIDLRIEPAGDPVEVVSPHGRSYIWTRKWPVVASGNVSGVDFRAGGLVDESAGYHARATAWEWAAGVGRSRDGRALAWNVVAGIHDAPASSERTVWVDGAASELGPATFGPDLERVAFDGGELRFAEESVRRRRDRLVVISSDYVQPFGTVTGSLSGGIEIAEGYGVMERHRARW
jgi:hypothetical protein